MSGGSNKAANAANAAESQRQAAIKNTQGQVNAVFNSPQRQADINDFVGATRDYYTQDLNRQKADADRGLKFGLARSGLTGGSTQVDQQQLLGQNYTRGVLDAEQKAQGAGASLQASDQDARARLITLATSGLDATTAAQQASSAMQSNLQAGKSAAQIGAMGDVFGSFNTFAKNTRDAQLRRQADAASGISPYAQGTATAGFGYGGAGGR